MEVKEILANQLLIGDIFINSLKEGSVVYKVENIEETEYGMLINQNKKYIETNALISGFFLKKEALVYIFVQK
nr:hypothetical protein [uncultured Flavobacterium sp.]